MTTDLLVPVDGCWVRRRGGDTSTLGIVIEHRLIAGDPELRVQWGGTGPSAWVPLTELRSGFLNDWAVQDVPLSATRRSLGQGRVVGRRELAGREQVLVELDDDGRLVWLPYENLRRIKDIRSRYLRAESGTPVAAERFRLKLLAHALENWNFLTGALDRLDIDPLPHQIQLVHRIMSSGNYNWLIADDVGLGKTIEVGLLLAALRRKGQGRRCLIVCPAGLTRQWQDELKFKFDQDYEIYGRDFVVNQPTHWKLHDHVIVSIDLAKRDDHLAVFLQAEGWDIVVFDEGHKLTRYGSGERAQRYKLAEALRVRSEAFVLLSGTPHQGHTDRFIALLELVRPDLKAELQTLEANPEVIRELILRNRKSEVTDAEGAFIFKGQSVHRVPIDPSAATQRFHRHLNDYLRRGYNAGSAAGATGRAIGFVMTTYRKLASSSIAAIENALRLRRERLRGRGDGGPVEETVWDSIDDMFAGGDDYDDLVNDLAKTSSQEFFASEGEMIDGLLEQVATVRAADEKLRVFLDDVVQALEQEGKKVLVFTEYRATQRYLADALAMRFPQSGAPLQINGSMSLDEKLQVIELFNDGPNRFLVSTEAGGEGLNLHRSCHVVVNYDLPWNPARLVQRIGRLYRYGQTYPVIVFNMHARDTFDNSAIDLMLQKVERIAADMSPVGTEFNARLYADIIGDILDNIDFGSVLQSAMTMEVAHTAEQVDEAVQRARQAKLLQDELFAHVEGFNPAELEGALGFTTAHVFGFVKAMLPFIGASIQPATHGGRVLPVRLPDSALGLFPEFGRRSVVRVTTDRRLAAELKDVVLLDFEASSFQHLIELAKSHRFDGLFAAVDSPGDEKGALAAFRLRWQNDHGERQSEEFISLFHTPSGIEKNPRFFVDWLVNPAEAGPMVAEEGAVRAGRYDALAAAAHTQLGLESSRFKHPGGVITLAAADFSTDG